MARADNIMQRVFDYYGLKAEHVTEGSPKKDAFRIKEARRVAAFLLYHDYKLVPRYIAKKVGYASGNSVLHASAEIPRQLERLSALTRYGREITIGEVIEDIRTGESVFDGIPYQPPVGTEKNREAMRRTGFGGIHYDERRYRRPWIAQLHQDGTTRYIGSYASADDARAAVVRAKRGELREERRRYSDAKAAEKEQERKERRDRCAEHKFKVRSRRRARETSVLWSSLSAAGGSRAR